MLSRANSFPRKRKPPFLGLWSRILDFRREELRGLLSHRKVVRATMMRGTLHLVSAADYLALRPAIQPALSRGMKSALRKRAEGLDVAEIVAVAAAFLDPEPKTFELVRLHLAKRWLNADARAMGYAVRTHLPLVQVPTGGDWAFPRIAEFGLAEPWLGESIDTNDDDPRELVLRYLSAFGPATPGDAQTWSGLAALAPVFDELRPQLRTFADERGRELSRRPLEDHRRRTPYQSVHAEPSRAADVSRRRIRGRPLADRARAKDRDPLADTVWQAEKESSPRTDRGGAGTPPVRRAGCRVVRRDLREGSLRAATPSRTNRERLFLPTRW